MRQKYIGKWVTYNINGDFRTAKIENVEFHQLLKKPLFHLVSPFGNRLKLTRGEFTLIGC